MSERKDMVQELLNCKTSLDDAQLMELMSEVEANEMLRAPAHMKEEILQKMKNPAVVLTVQTKKASKKVQLFLYSLKISTAVAVALTAIVAISMPVDTVKIVPSQETSRQEWNITERIYEKSNSITTLLDEFSNQMLKPKQLPIGRQEKK